MKDIAISVNNVSKKYHLYDTPQHRMMEALHPLRKKYHRDFWALHDVSFEVKKGEVVGIIGRNGSGKSTLLQILAGTLTPTSGGVTVNGRVAALLELGSGFNSELTGRENVFINGAILGIDHEEMERRFDDITAFAEIGEFIDQPVKTYSSGMYVRLAFSVAVCVDPEILIIDEALSVGDMAFQQKCLERLRVLKENGVTVLLVTHDIMLTRNYCESVVYLQKGRVVLVANAEIAGEAYIKDMKSDVQKLVDNSLKERVKRSHIRFGSNDGEITKVEVTNPASSLPIFAYNELLRICINARVKKSILYPRIYIQIRDLRGYIIYGFHTLPDEILMIDEGEYLEICATLFFRAILGPGEYSVTASINDAPGELTQVILDKRVGAATFTMLPIPAESRAFQGVVNLNGVWRKGDSIKETSHEGKMTSSTSLVIGCVAENTPKYLSQALRLLQSIRWFGGKVADARFIVCVVEGIEPEYGDEFQKYSADVRIVERFSEKHPQSNKLRFLQQSDLQQYKYVLLLDCDTIVVQDPTPYLYCDGLRAKIADAPTVSSKLFKKLFDFFKLSLPKDKYTCTVTGTPTIPYFNAGVLLFSQAAMSSLVPAWIELNEQLIEQIDLLEGSSNFCEQASLSLALAATGTHFDIFGNEMNFPMHFNNYMTTLDKMDPLIIHYHSLVTLSGIIENSKYQLVNDRIMQFNNRLREEREKLFDNKLFWNDRYTENPDLGSGIGSRGTYKDYKCTLLKNLMDSNRFESILDIGCGDMVVSSILPASGYVGIDISNVIINRNKELHPGRTFYCGDFLSLDLSPADLVICMDVLIHLSSFEHYQMFITKLVNLTQQVGIVAGYEADPGCHGIIFFHEPLSDTLKRSGAKRLCRLGSYRDTDIWMFSA